MQHKSLFMICALISSWFCAGPALTAEGATVRGVLFYEPFCEQCTAVVDEFLLPLTTQYPGQLELLPLDTTDPQAAELRRAAASLFPDLGAGTEEPALIVGDTAMVGQASILGRFPALLEEHLAGGGTQWPPIPGLSDRLGASTDVAPPELAPLDAFLAWSVMACLLLAVVYLAWRIKGSELRIRSFAPARSIWIPTLACFGFAISFYLAYVGLTDGDAICGPVGDCNRVQSSPYAQLLGIPMPFLGMTYYLAVGAVWLGQRWVGESIRGAVSALLVALSVFGVLFSIYLTVLELFVIVAVCLWCLASAVLTALIMLLASASLSRAVVTSTEY